MGNEGTVPIVKGFMNIQPLKGFLFCEFKPPLTLLSRENILGQLLEHQTYMLLIPFGACLTQDSLDAVTTFPQKKENTWDSQFSHVL